MSDEEDALKRLLQPRDVPQLVAAFFAEDCAWDEPFDHPEVVWGAVLEILKHDLTEEQEALLAAGPLEDVLYSHGATIIDRVEEEARTNPRFNHLLGGVWRQGMSEEIWSRVEKARKEVW